jgi:NADH-quinone oxidoreductase subunit E
MLTDQERQEIAAELVRSHDARAAVLGALQIVQQHRRWVADEHVLGIAELLDLTAEEVDSVATFYSHIFRQPVGRHVILICDSVSCWIMGHELLRDHLIGKLGVGLGETTSDGRFTLLPAACLGACERAPAMMVDEDLHGLLTPEKIDDVLAQYE